MPKASANVLGTDREVRAAASAVDRTDYRIRGAPGLQLRVSLSGAKSWSVAYQSPVTGKWAKVGIGKFPSIGLAEARDAAGDVLASVRKGADPIKDRAKPNPLGSFRELAELYMREHAKKNANGERRSRTTEEAQRILDHDVLPYLADHKPEAVTRAHVMAVVERVAERGSLVVADRVLATVRAVYNWACGAGRLEWNPTLGLKKRNATRPKQRVLSAAEIAVLWRYLVPPGVSAAICDALRLQLLTGQRISEVLEAPRDEFDLEAAVWTLPAERTKARREHPIPLSPAAVALVRAIMQREDAAAERRARRDGVDQAPVMWMFPSERSRRSVVRREDTGNEPKRSRRTDGAHDAHAATRALVRLREPLLAAGITAPFNTHDLRRTVATHMGEMGVADDVIARVLNHAPRTVTGRHYNHARQTDVMRAALDQWAIRVSAIVEVPRG